MLPQTQSPASDDDTGESPESAQAQKFQRLDALADRLRREAQHRVGLRQALEERWLQDLRQYNGVYDDDVLQKIVANEGSQVFVNITRPKAKTAESRLGDMLFPTDDKNWDVKPTPVPELKQKLGDKSKAYDSQGKPMVRQGPSGEHVQMTVGERAREIMDAAKQRAEGMKSEIDDQLTEASYPSKCRQVIHDAVVYGTGVLKGPIVVGRTRRAWQPVVANGRVVHVLQVMTDTRPGAEWVSIWNFFPDMSVAVMEDCRDVFERRYKNNRDMLKLLDDPYYIRENVIRAIRAGAKASQVSQNPISDIRENTSNRDQAAPPSVENEQFELWEYHGPITNEDLRACGCDVEGEDDGLTEQMGCVVFCGSVVIKAYINPLETGDLPYSVFNYEKDEGSIFGFGVPYRLRNAQSVINGAWRTLMENMGLSSAPQIVISKSVQPEDGDPRLTRGKVWRVTDGNKDVRAAMATFNIDSHQQELNVIIETTQRFADEESALPLIAQGEQGPHITKTLGGMSILMNSANVVTRATVKNYDDGITTPVIRRFYDWNMQNNPNDEIKGDFEVDARGSSVLLSKEIQAQNLMALGANFAGHPIFGTMTKHAALYRKLVTAMHVSADEIVKSDDELAADAQKMKEQGAAQDPKVIVEKMRQDFEALQAELEQRNAWALAAAQHDADMIEKEFDRETKMIEVAARERMSLDQIKKELVLGSVKRAQFNREVALKKSHGSGI